MIVLFMSLLVPVTTMSVRCVRSVEQSFTAVYNKGDKFATSHFMALKEIESASKSSNNGANVESFDLTSKYDDYTLTLKKYYIKYPYQIHNVFKELTITHKGKKVKQVRYKLYFDEVSRQIRSALLEPSDYDKMMEECKEAKKGFWVDL